MIYNIFTFYWSIYSSSLNCKCIALAMVFFAVFVVSATATQPLPMREGLRIYVEQVREPFPNIRFYDAKGEQVALSDSNGIMRLVNFWATWCVPCIAELPELQTLQQRYNNRLQVLTVNQDKGGFNIITPFITKHRVNELMHYWDKHNVEYSKLQMQGLPMSFLLDAQGNLIATIEGRIDWLGRDIAELIDKR